MNLPRNVSSPKRASKANPATVGGNTRADITIGRRMDVNQTGPRESKYARGTPKSTATQAIATDVPTETLSAERTAGLVMLSQKFDQETFDKSATIGNTKKNIPTHPKIHSAHGILAVNFLDMST